VSCAYRLCAAVDGVGNVLYQPISENGHGSWSEPHRMYKHLNRDGSPTAVSCADAEFCVAVTSSGYAAVLEP